MKAALTCFSENGFEGASIADIARAAGLRHPLVHYHFKSKDLLWRAAAEFAFKDLVIMYQAIGITSADLKPLDALKVLIKAFVRFCGRYPEHIGLLLGEAKTRSDRFTWLVETCLRPLHRDFDKLIARAVEKGEVRDLPAAHFSSMVIGAAAQFVSSRAVVQMLYDIDPLDPKRIGDHADLMIDIFFHGIIASPPAD